MTFIAKLWIMGVVKIKKSNTFRILLVLYFKNVTSITRNRRNDWYIRIVYVAH